MRLAFDIFPADDVRGTRLIRLEGDDYLQGSMFRTELVGMGRGKLVVNVEQSFVNATNFARDNYVEVFDLELSGAYSLGAFFLEEGDFDALSSREEAGRILSFEGRGELSYLSRGILGPTALSEAHGPLDQHWIDTLGSWKWGSLETETYGGILRRIIYESALMTPDPLPEVQLVDIDWDDTVDRDAVPWPTFTGEYDIPVGTNLLQAVADLLKHGIELVVNADFQYQAYNAGGYGTDRTSATFATNKVRFEAGINIAADLSRAIHGSTDASHALLKDRTGLNFEVVPSPEYSGGDVVKYVGIEAPENTGPEDLEFLGENVLTNRHDYVDQFVFPHPTGYEPLEGLYVPGPPDSAGHYWKGDYVTIHTGTSPYDANEQTIRVAAIEWNVDEAGNWLPTVELGAQYLSVGEARFASQLSTLVSSPHTHPPNPELCRIAHSTSSVTRLYPEADSPAVVALAPLASWEDTSSDAPMDTLVTSASGDYSSTGGVNTSVGGIAGGQDVLYWRGAFQMDAAMAAVIAAGGATIHAQFRARARYGIGISESAQNMISQIGVQVTVGSTTTARGTALALHSLSSSAGLQKWPAQSTTLNRQFPPPGQTNTLSAVSGTVAGDWLVVEMGNRNFTTATSGGKLILTGDAVSDLPQDEATSGHLNSWIEIHSGGTDYAGDIPLDTVLQDSEAIGTSIRAARCDHQHAHGLLSADGTAYHDLSAASNYIFHGPTAPTVTDDADDGFMVGSHWIDGSTGDVYILTDATGGSAVWEQINGAGGGASDLDDLTDVDTTSTPPADGDSLVYDSGSSLWLPTPVTAGDHNHTTGGDGGDLDAAVIGDFLEFTEASAPSTPATGFARVYAKSDGRIYSKDEGGTEYGPFDAAGAGAALNLSAAPAGYPSLQAAAVSRSTTDTTSHSVTLPSGIVAGNLLVLTMALDGVPTISATGWTSITNASNTVALQSLYRIATGSEGASVTVTSSASEKSESWVGRFSAAHASAAPEGASIATGTSSTTPNPPAVTPTWGSAANTWLVMMAWDLSAGAGIVATSQQPYPTFVVHTRTTGATDGVGLLIVISYQTLLTWNPDPFGITASEQYTAATVAIRPV